MSTNINFLRFLVAVLVSVGLTACGGGSSKPGAPTVPKEVRQSTAQAGTSGTSVTLSVTATGTDLLFRWQLSTDAGLTWADILDATASQYTIASLSYAMNGNLYRAIVSNSEGSATSEPTRLIVRRATAEVFRDCTNGCPELVTMPEGTYEMGVRAATDVFRDQSSPVHSVAMRYALAVARTEVTRGEFAQFVQATSYITDAERGAGCRVSNASAPVLDLAASWRDPRFSQSDTEPVVCVSWNDTQAYLAWLNTLSTASNFRLLTEAEWEFVARGGEQVSRYPWGDDLTYQTICAHANSGDQTATATVPRFAQTQWTNCADGQGYTAPVDAYPANAFGLRHVIGNVWEWVQDGWHVNYTGAPADGSSWPVTNGDSTRIYRGGSWNNHPTYLDPAYRARGAPTYAEEGLGFRVARSL